MGKRPEGQPDRRHQNPGRPPGKTHPLSKVVRVTAGEAAALAKLSGELGISEAAVFRLGLKVLLSAEEMGAAMSARACEKGMKP